MAKKTKHYLIFINKTIATPTEAGSILGITSQGVNYIAKNNDYNFSGVYKGVQLDIVELTPKVQKAILKQ